MTFIKKIKDNISGSKQVTNLVEKSKTSKLPGFKGVSFFDTLKQIRYQLVDDNIIERASAISYNFVMALPPAIIFLFTLIPYLPINDQFIHELYGLIRDIVPGRKNFTAVRDFLNDFLTNPRNGLLSFGFILSLFFASNALMGLMRAFDKNLPGFVKRKGIKKRLNALKITLVLFLLFFICIALMVAQGVVLKWIGIESLSTRRAIGNFRWILIVVLFYTIISIIYRYVPSIDKKWRIFTPGAVLATVLMLLFALVFSWWVGNFGSYNKLYGSIGTMIIIMVLVFVNSLALLIGFELNASIFSLAKKYEEERLQAKVEDVLL